MGLLNNLAIIIARLPLERLMFRGPNRVEYLDKLEKTLGATEGVAQGSSPPVEAGAEPREAIEQRLGAISQGPVTSKEETVAYQNRELGKELLLLEKHLQQGCRIPAVTGGPCDCCSPKHTVTIEALALETYGMTGDPLYQEIAQWANKIEGKTTIEEIESGKHNYGDDAVAAREYRKRVLGTESLSALIGEGAAHLEAAKTQPQITLEEAKAEAARLAAEEVKRGNHGRTRS